MTQWFHVIHDRELSARRAKEISAAAKQGREYFRNAAAAAYSVRPLLTFYGVVSLSRALVLLLKPQGGEEGLTAAHGIETVAWGDVMSGDVADALRALEALRIRTTAGLFSDFVAATKNYVSIHINSAASDWGIWYDIPKPGIHVSLSDLLARIPDLSSDFKMAGGVPLYAPVNALAYSTDSGLSAKVLAAPFSVFRSHFVDHGFVTADDGDWVNLKCDRNTVYAHTPYFVHAYVHKVFGTIPRLHLAKPFTDNAVFSQIAVTYMVAYVLGMLVRYYPTHWVSLSQGEKGDIWWPTLNRAHGLVEQSFPELIIEMIDEVLKDPQGRR